MDKSIFRYVWRHSRRDQLVVLFIVLSGLPFYFLSLDLPKRIVNEAIQGRAFPEGQSTALFLQLTLPLPSFLGGPLPLFSGVPLPRMEYLFGLAGLFLLLVLINGAFKYMVNIRKGILGERVMRRMRYELFARLLRFPPEAMRNLKPAEAASMIKDEVEPIGGFMGEAFVTPMFSTGMAVTALTFIFVQNAWLGILTASIIGIQGIIIPKLRREQLRLGKMRQLASRKLAGRVGEVVEGITAIQVHDTRRFESADMGRRLGELFDIRFKLYKRKFAVKFLNNLLAQFTPFLFFAVGGYLALTGQLDIGQLVAVIAAYRDVPPPIKELIDWDQQRQDIEIKYEQIVLQFGRDDLVPDQPVGAVIAPDAPLLVEARGLTIRDGRGGVLLDGVSLHINLPAHVALMGPGGGGQDVFARALARRVSLSMGQLFLAGHDFALVPPQQLAPIVAYVGPDPVIVPGSLRDNVLYGLKRAPTGAGLGDIDLREAERTGNSADDVGADWIDYRAAGVDSADEIDDRVIDTLRIVGMDADVYRFGLSGRVSRERHGELATRIVEARHAVQRALAEQGKRQLVETFDAERFNRNATIGENLLFGVPVGETFSDVHLATNAFVRAVIEAEDMTRRLTAVGLKIAETMVEIFDGLPAGHPLFERFAFMSAEELPQYAELVERWKTRRRGDERAADRDRLIMLAFVYVEPRHRLGLLSPELEQEIVQARATFRRLLPPDMADAVEFYDANELCAAAPIRDNLLFGRIAYGAAGAGERVQAVIRRVVEDMGLSREIYRVGLEFQPGQGGRGLFTTQRAAVDIARSLIKRPPVLVLDDALASFSDEDAARLMDRIREACRGRGLVATMREGADAGGFDQILYFADGRIKGNEQDEAVEPPAAQVA